MLRIVFDVPNLVAKRKELEQIAAQPEFWGNQADAKKHMLNLDDVRDQLQLLDKWKMFISDAEASLELYSLEPEEEMIVESHQGLVTLRENLDKWEFQRLLCGEYDKEAAIVSINAGAGGTDAQDWVEILLRMYSRWADNNGMSLEITDLSDGEEAGIKSCTLLIEGFNAYGWGKTESGVHRLVRISPFDSSSRRHTSFASIWVYPEINDEIDIERPWLTTSGEVPKYTKMSMRFGLSNPEQFALIEPALKQLQRDMLPFQNLSLNPISERSSIEEGFNDEEYPITWAIQTGDPVIRFVAADSMQDEMQETLLLGLVFCTFTPVSYTHLTLPTKP